MPTNFWPIGVLLSIRIYELFLCKRNKSVSNSIVNAKFVKFNKRNKCSKKSRFALYKTIAVWYNQKHFWKRKQ